MADRQPWPRPLVERLRAESVHAATDREWRLLNDAADAIEEARRRLAEQEWYARATCEEPRACGECAGCAELRRRADAGEMLPSWDQAEDAEP